MVTSPWKSCKPSAEQQILYYCHHCSSTLRWLRIAAQQAYLPAHPASLLPIASFLAFDHNSFSLCVELRRLLRGRLAVMPSRVEGLY